MASGWIIKENLEPFIEMVAYLADYKVDDYDWAAIRHGVHGSQERDKKWFEYPLLGTRPVSLQASLADDGAVALLRVESENGFSPETEAQLELLFLVCETYDVTIPRGPK